MSLVKLVSPSGSCAVIEESVVLYDNLSSNLSEFLGGQAHNDI